MSETSGLTGEQNKKPPLVIEIPESELSWRTEADAFGFLLSELKDKGFDNPDSLLFRGMDGGKLLATGTHGNATSVFAMSAEQYLAEAQQLDDTGSSQYGGTPLWFARNEAIEQPVIVVYSAELLANTPESEEESEDVRYSPVTNDVTIDDALLAIIKLT